MKWEDIEKGLTAKQCEFVRDLRVDQDYTWRAIARDCAVMWGGDWGSNQIAGMDICRKAAEHFGEHFMNEPWN